MYTLNEKEVQILNDYYSLSKQTHTLKKMPRSFILEIQVILESLLKELCNSKYNQYPSNITEAIDNVISRDKKYIKGIDVKGYPKFKDHFIRFRTWVKQINNIGNPTKHESYIPGEDEPIIYKNYLRDCIKWYFNYGLNLSIGDINSTHATALKALTEMFPTDIMEEFVVERETYYVILLIDSSMSMLWPYLEDENNKANFKSKDFQQAVKKIQTTMESAHEKALGALRGSAACIQKSMKIYQYLFNHERVELNKYPEKLSADGNDNVFRLKADNYDPNGQTSLYDTIEEALRIIYTGYLKPVAEKSKRVDKLSIGVITDGRDTIIEGVVNDKRTQSEYQAKKAAKLRKIEALLRILQGTDNPREIFLEGSVVIGLTNNDFPEKELIEIQKELGFRESISINQADDESIRKAFSTFSINAINI